VFTDHPQHRVREERSLEYATPYGMVDHLNKNTAQRSRTMTDHRRAMFAIVLGLTFLSMAGCKDDRYTLLCKTDHQVLLEASRKLLGSVSKGEVKPGRYVFGRDPLPQPVSDFHTAIRPLAPTYVVLDEGYLRLELRGGFDHVGVKAYPADFNEPYPDFTYGRRKLIDGLWYYDDGYIDNPAYDKKIDSIIDSCAGKESKGEN